MHDNAALALHAAGGERQRLTAAATKPCFSNTGEYTNHDARNVTLVCMAAPKTPLHRTAWGVGGRVCGAW